MNQGDRQSGTLDRAGTRDKTLWYTLEPQDALSQIGTDPHRGLSQSVASDRLKQNGANELSEPPLKSPWRMLWEQLTATTVVVLIVAAVASALLGDLEDALAILAIVVFNAVLGFTQEYRAGKEFAALKKMAVPKARVRRDGDWQQILARDLVVGDIVQLEDGDQVPADCRLLENTNLRTQESAFTGESESVEKQIAKIEGHDLPLGDRRNMVYMGTAVTYGRARALVTATGMDTELGKIADSIQSVEAEQTPLQKRLDQLGKRLAVAALALVAIMFAIGLARGGNVEDLFLTAVSLAVAIIPEGLPAVVTIALAIGSRRMLKRQALIRKLPAVETLGSVTTICSDKTGTLTENRMTVKILALAGEQVELRESFAEITSRLNGNKSIFRPGDGVPLSAPIALTLAGSALCNNALVQEDENGEDKALGDPTEIALVVAADRLGLGKEELEVLLPRVAEAPFDSDRKRMTTIHKWGDRQHWEASDVGKLILSLTKLPDSPYIALTKGAIDGMLEVSTHVWDEGQKLLDAERRDRILQDNDRLASMGTRVLGVAFRLLDDLPPPGRELEVEQDLVMVGLVGMLDPARPEAKTAVQTCNAAGIRTVMITGDHPLMARTIARDLEISSNDEYLTGQQLNQLSTEELGQRVGHVSVFARVSPQQKLKIVEALKNRGEIVSMTGDGVNDAPALRKADIGVAMGITGTDVAKEAADMVLLNDSFSTIVAAVEEGRVIYDNIRKFIRYNLTGNVSGVVLMLLAPLIAMPLPLRPIQILWINLLADGLLALALSVEPAEKNVMQRPPYPPGESVFSRGVGRDIVWIGTLMGVIFLGFGYWAWSTGRPDWQTMVFATLAFSRIWLALAMRSENRLLAQIGLLTNKAMLAAVLLTFALQMAVMTLPFFQRWFETQPLTGFELWSCVGVSTVGFWAVEIQKLVRR
ncbi:MAG: cation-translocating P-type ATPase, partial [Cyanobacteria bacterium J069]